MNFYIFAAFEVCLKLNSLNIQSAACASGSCELSINMLFSIGELSFISFGSMISLDVIVVVVVVVVVVVFFFIGPTVVVLALRSVGFFGDGLVIVTVVFVVSVREAGT